MRCSRRQQRLTLLPEVSQYIATLKPSKNAQYVLVNATGAGDLGKKRQRRLFR